MARNRKRARDTRRTQPVAARPGDRSGLPGEGRSRTPERAHEQDLERNGAPDPLSHATPDAELVEAQLAAGRQDVGAGEPFDEIDTPEEERELEELATGSGGGGGRRGAARTARGGGGGELTPASATGVAGRKPSTVSRLMTFLRGSWAELQRVQWPDRRQVMQATGVVVGFVIVAGVYLGVADWAAGKIMDFILR